MQSADLDLTNKRKNLLLDLLITGTCYFRVLESSSGDNIKFETLNSLHTFLDRNYESQYNKHASRGVVRKFLTQDEIILEFGEYLSQEDIDSLDVYKADYYNSNYIRSYSNIIGPVGEGTLGSYEVTPNSLNYDRAKQHYNRFPVYDIE